MVTTGRLSYSLYLWHWPVLVFGRELFPYVNQEWLSIILVTIAVILSGTSWYFVEDPIRKG